MIVLASNWLLKAEKDGHHISISDTFPDLLMRLCGGTDVEMRRINRRPWKLPLMTKVNEYKHTVAQQNVYRTEYLPGHNFAGLNDPSHPLRPKIVWVNVNTIVKDFQVLNEVSLYSSKLNSIYCIASQSVWDEPELFSTGQSTEQSASLLAPHWLRFNEH